MLARNKQSVGLVGNCCCSERIRGVAYAGATEVRIERQEGREVVEEQWNQDLTLEADDDGWCCSSSVITIALKN